MLQIRHLEKIIAGRSVLSIDELDIQAGEVVAVIGPAGCGKTLLLHMLAGIIPASGGSALFHGQEMLTGKKHEQVSILFAEDLLYKRLTVHNNLAFFCRLYGLPASRIGEVLSLTGMSDQERKTVKSLSSSSQRRLAFARFLLERRPLWLLDQPASRTDLDTQNLFVRLIKQAASEGTTILLTDDTLAWASRCCTRAIELEDGRIINTYTLGQMVEGEAAPLERLIPFKIPARKEDRILLYDPGDVLYATSRDGKTYLRTADEEIVTNFTLQELEARLSGRGFFKAHRAYLVNLQRIRAVIQYTRNSYLLLLDDKQQTNIPLSKQSEKALQELLGY